VPGDFDLCLVWGPPHESYYDIEAQEIWHRAEQTVGRTIIYFRYFELLFNGRGRTVSYDELARVDSMSAQLARRNGEYYRADKYDRWLIDAQIGELRKMFEVNSRNPKIILKRPGYGYTISVKGQVESNDEGPIFDRPKVVEVRRAIKDGATEIGTGLGYVFFFGIIVVGLVLFYLVLMMAGG